MVLASNRRFELRRELGRGGMGVVYEAFDTERQQPVALKMLHRRDPQTIVDLKQEFRSLSEISHPHLISMYELLGDEQDWFFTMEFVRDGRNFMDWLRMRMGEIEIKPVEIPASDTSSEAPTLPAGSSSDATTLVAPSPSGDEPTLESPSGNEDKSALVAEFLRRLGERAEFLFFRSRCYEQESVPYKTMDGLADEIAHWLAQRTEAEQRAYMPPTAHALAQIFPVFRRVPCIAAAARAEQSDLELLRRQSFEAVGELLRRISHAHPLVLCIDDLQWGDSDGVEMLSVALGQSSLHLLLIVTFREEYTGTSPCLKALLGSESQTRAVVEDIAVKPLDREESLAWLA